MGRRCLLAIRIRGGVNTSAEVEDTLEMLRMERNNTATLLDDRPEYLGMLRKAKDRITWGEPTAETIRLLLERRGETRGGGGIEADTLKALGYGGMDELAAALADGRTELGKLGPVKPFFRLHPPRKGFKRTVKRAYGEGGELGDRGEAVNELARRMC